jgi:hypothetical protein
LRSLQAYTAAMARLRGTLLAGLMVLPIAGQAAHCLTECCGMQMAMDAMCDNVAQARTCCSYSAAAPVQPAAKPKSASVGAVIAARFARPVFARGLLAAGRDSTHAPRPALSQLCVLRC